MRLSGPATGAAPGPLSDGVSVPEELVQLRADLFGTPVAIGRNREASGAGAAALAGVAAGCFATLREASLLLSATERRIEPRDERRVAARGLVERFGELVERAGGEGAVRRED